MKKNIAQFGILFFALLIAVGCGSNNDKKARKEESKDTELVIKEIIDEEKEFERVLNQFKTLHEELMRIKDEPDFKIYGFGAGGPYKNWMKKVEDLDNDPFAKLLLRKQIAPGDLKTLAIEYSGTGGKENEFTRNFTSILSHAFAPEVVIEEPQTISDGDYQLFGKWSVENKYSSRLSHQCEIYFNGKDYYSVLTFSDKSKKQETLRKEGNKYFIVGNKSGDYYLINPNDKKMTLYDRQGVLDMFAAKLIN